MSSQQTIQDVLTAYGFNKSRNLCDRKTLWKAKSVVDNNVYVLVETGGVGPDVGTLWVDDNNRFACAGIKTEEDLQKALKFYNIELKQVQNK